MWPERPPVNASVGPTRIARDDMAKKKKAIKLIDRADPYIDSPLMTQRVRYKQELSARIDGNYGVYRTHAQIGRLSSARCSCPSEGWPCKHVVALRETWKINPDSFFDVAAILADLANKPKADLVKLIGMMAMAAPESLGACGVKAFEPDETGNEFY